MIYKVKNLEFSIAIDGSAASGKTTGSKIIAKHFNFKLLSSGRLYRFLAFRMIKDKKKLKDRKYLEEISKNISISKLKNKKLNTQNVSYLASKIAKNIFVRKILRNFQANFSKNKRFIIEGRDIGSVILPNADLKIFFKCSTKEKAKRRLKEFKKINKKITLKEVEKALKSRDFSDKNRKESPLLFVKGAVELDTTKLTIKQMELKLVKLVKKKLFNKYGSI